jgi:hypothetical protein
MVGSMRRSPLLVLLGVAMALAVFTAGCGGDDDGGEEESAAKPVEGKFVGRSGKTFVAVLTAGGNVTAYACDGRRVAERFDGESDGTAADLTSTKGARLRLRLSETPVTGTLRVEGQAPVQFSAEPAKGKAGYYAARKKVDGREIRLGWVALNSGEWRGGVTQPPNVQPAGDALAGESLSGGLCSPGSVCDLCKIAPQLLGRRCVSGATGGEREVRPQPQPAPSG